MSVPHEEVLGVPLDREIGEDELAEWNRRIDRAVEDAVAKVNSERAIVRWRTLPENGYEVEDEHVQRAARLACDFLIGRRVNRLRDD